MSSKLKGPGLLASPILAPAMGDVGLHVASWMRSLVAEVTRMVMVIPTAMRAAPSCFSQPVRFLGRRTAVSVAGLCRVPRLTPCR